MIRVIIFTFFICCFSKSNYAQLFISTTIPSQGQYTVCNSVTNNNNSCNLTFNGGLVWKVNSISGTTVTFHVYKYNTATCLPGSTSFPAGTVYIKDNASPCGAVLASANYSANTFPIVITHNFTNLGNNQIVATITSGTTRWYSEPITVTVAAIPPQATTLISPANNSCVNFSPTPTFSWTAVPNATNYIFHLLDITNGINNPTNVLPPFYTNNTSYTVSNVLANWLPNKPYAWYVEACIGTNCTNSSVWLFNSTPTQKQATSNSPLNVGNTLNLYSNNIDNGVSFSWNGPNGFTSNITHPIIPNVQLNQAGTYTVIVANSYGCSYSSSTNVSLNQQPSCTIANAASISTEAYNATCYLIQQSILDNNQDGIYNRDNPIIRQDLAKVSYKGLFNGEPTNPALNFPTPFLDLQTTNSYHKYALALSYLEFTDNVSPFSRSFISFNPTGNITRVNTLKVLLEAFNINEANYPNVVLPFNDVSNLSTADLNYIKAAFQLGLISNQTSFNPTVFIKRQDVFIMLYRLLTNNSIQKPSLAELQNVTNYFLPSNITPFNANNARGLAEGNFTYFGTSSFNIPDKVGFSLNFDHSYFSQLTEIQDTLVPNDMEIFGRGWTHTYFNYIIGIDNVKLGDDPNLKDYLFNVNPDGTYEVYNNVGSPTNPISVTKGNYNKLQKINATTFELTTKAQMKIKYQKQIASSNIYVLTEIKDRNDNKLLLSYIANSNKLEFVTAPSGRFIKLVYSNNLVRVEYPLNRVLTFNLTNGRLTNYKQNNNIHLTTYGYEKPNQSNLLTKIVLPKGNSVLNEYNNSGKLKFSTTNDVNNVETKVTITPPANYDAQQQTEAQVQYENNLNYVYKYKYNNVGLPYRIEANMDWAEFQYGDINHPTVPTQINNSNSATVKFENLDNYGNPRLITNPMGFTEKFTYNTDGTIDTYIDKMNRLFSFEYWAGNRGNLKFLVMPYEGSIRRNQYAYNPDGSLQFTINPEGIVTNYEYNTYGNLTKIIQPGLNITTETKYDAASRPYEITDAKGNKTSIDYDENDNPKKLTDAYLKETKLEYDDNYNLSNIINAKIDTTKLRYDYNDRLETESFWGTNTYGYNPANGKPSFLKRPSGKTFYFNYDTKGRLASDGYISWINYHPTKGDVTQIAKVGHTLNFVTDNDYRLKEYTDGFNNRVQYSLRADGSIDEIIYPDGKKVKYIYDNAGRLKTVVWNNTTTIATYNYLLDDRLSTVVYGNGITLQNEYDAGGRLIALHHLKTNIDTLASYKITLDNNGNFKNIYQKQPLAEVLMQIGEMTTLYKRFNVLDKVGTLQIDINADGNVEKRGLAVATYDLADNLTNYINGTVNYSAKYDGLGIRREATRNGVVTRYIKDISGKLDNVLAETDGNNATNYYYIQGLGMLARISPNGTVQYYHHNLQGSTIAVTDANKNVTHSYAYNEWGAVTNKQEQNENLYRFMGKYGITYEDSSLYYVRARYYDPLFGRFYSQDPVWDINLYNYAGNNPFKNIDPSGRTYFNHSADLFDNLQSKNSKQLGDWGENFGQRILKENFEFEFSPFQEKKWNGTRTTMDIPLTNGIGVEVKTTGKSKPRGTLTIAQKEAKLKLPEKYSVMKISAKSLNWELRGAINAAGKGLKVITRFADRVSGMFLFFDYFDATYGRFINSSNQIIY